MRLAMAMAAVAPLGFEGGSNETNHVSPFPSLAVKPGANPDDFSRVSVHREASGGWPLMGPVASSAAVSVRVPTRLVNQLESGTSSTVLMFFARVPDATLPDVTNRL